jgi:hypothetical protein
MLYQTLPNSRVSLLRGWSVLAVASLALAGIFAILLVLSRIPGAEVVLPWPTAFFQKGLIVHVILSFAVWYLAVFGCLSQISQNIESTPIEKISLGLAISGTILILIPALLDRGEPTLNNYIPIIIDPLYYTGLTLLMLGVLGGISPILTKTTTEPNLKGPVSIYIIAIIAFIIAIIQLSDQPLSHDYNERLTWGGGHILQCLNVTLLIVAWSYLADIRQPNTPFKLAIAWLIMTSLVGIIFYIIWPILDESQTEAFTHLQKALGPPVLIFAVILIPALRQNLKTFSWQDPSTLSLWTSIILFASGGVLGFFVDGTDTRTPAHYHGVIGGINLAFVGLFYSIFLPQLGRPIPTGKLITSQIIFYSVGQFLFILGMFIAGGMGAARKVMGTAIDMDSSIAVIAARIRDFGGGLAIIGGILFIYVALRALLHRPVKISSLTK